MMFRRLPMFAWLLLLLGVTASAFAGRTGSPFKMVDSSSNGYSYAYAPSMIYDNGTFYCWYGSTGAGIGDWDNIRYSTSSDGVNWSAPQDVIHASNATTERCCCDPSTIYYNGYWYIFYSGNALNVQTVEFVARATSPGGPWYKLTDRGTWEQNPADPKRIISPLRPTPDGSNYYGAGQATTVVRDGRIYMWWTDDSSNYPNGTNLKIYFASSTDPGNWPAGTVTNLPYGSGDVKWNPYTQLFQYCGLHDQHLATAAMERYFSKDGVHWSGPYNYTDMPDWCNNDGTLGDKSGWVCRNTNTIWGMGAPYDLNPSYNNNGTPPYCWAYWDLYGVTWRDPVVVKGDFDGDGKLDPCIVDAATGKWYIRSSLTGQQGVPGIPWGWQWGGMGPQHIIVCGDYDGDGKTDRAIVDPIGTGGQHWYVISSATGGLGTPDIPWGWLWSGSGPQHKPVVGDFDGDGKTDRTIIDMNYPGGATWYIISSATGGGGVPGIPWGWQWPGMSDVHQLALGDYDGDGRTDRAIVNLNGKDSNNNYGIQWWVTLSSTGQPPATIPWGSVWAGTTMFTPVIADFDGDHKADRVVVSPFDTGLGCRWYGISTATGAALAQFGWGEVWAGHGDHHQIVCGDYDGDGKADRTIADQDFGSGMLWYSIGSAGGYPFPWGYSMSIPYN